MRDLVCYGAGGVGRSVHQIIVECNQEKPRWRFLGFIDDDSILVGTLVGGQPVLGGATWLLDHPHTDVVVAAGAPAIRRKMIRGLGSSAASSLTSAVHPDACIADSVTVGEGSIIYPGVIVDPDVTIGPAALLNKNVTVGHDAQISGFVTLGPGANVGGRVCLGEGCEMGLNSGIVPGVRVGPWTIIGAGAVVVGNLPPNCTAVGVPARVIKTRPEGWQDW